MSVSFWLLRLHYADYGQHSLMLAEQTTARKINQLVPAQDNGEVPSTAQRRHGASHQSNPWRQQCPFSTPSASSVTSAVAGSNPVRHRKMKRGKRK